MTDQSPTGQVSLNVRILLAVSLTSVSLIGLQVVLMRALSITRYHHFSYLVISTALLGFGASGTFLSFAMPGIKRRFRQWSQVLFLLFILSFPAGYYLSQIIPVDIQYILYSGEQVLYTLLFNLCLLLPFFFGGTILGMALSYFSGQTDMVYGMDLLGSGVGGILSLLVMFLVPPTRLPSVIAVLVFMAFLFWTWGIPAYFQPKHRMRTILVLFVGFLIAVVTVFDEPPVHIDQYKMLSQMERLQNQGDAERLLWKFSPRGRIDVYESRRIHQTLFAGLSTEALPPEQLGVLFNGGMIGTVFRVDSSEGAKIMDYTPQSMPYRLIENPKVLLLGEVDGTNVWLAQRFGAAQITVVQTNPHLVEVLREDLKMLSGGVYARSNVNVITQEPRLFLERTEEKYDIIQISRAEGMAAGQSGLQTLHENYLLTVQAMERSLEVLTSDGLLSFTRGIQSPPRDNLKFFATAVQALENSGISSPDHHLLMSRNYLAANTILAKSPLNAERIRAFLDACQILLMDREYYPGVDSEDMTQRNKVPGPPGKAYSYYHHGIMKILFNDRQQFYRDWAYNIKPATDLSPYFYNFFKWQSVGRFVETYGRQWLQKLELGYMVVVITLVEVTVVGVLLILVPLGFLRKTRLRSGGKAAVIIHFSGIGIGFMFFEMVAIQQFGKFLGDPVYSAAAVLTSILVFAGGGSLLHKRFSNSPMRRIRTAVTWLLLITIAYLFALTGVLQQFLGNSVILRFGITVLLLAPPAFFLGWVFPSGLSRLDRHAPDMIPWAWGINGVASVAASPLAILLSMEMGFVWVILIAAGLYAVVALNTYFWKSLP